MNEQRKRFVLHPSSDRAIAKSKEKGSPFVMYDLHDIFEYGKEWETWCKENLVVDLENKQLVLRFYGDYAIEFKRARTHQMILEWVVHLLGKRIFIENEDGCEVIAEIAEILCAQAGLSIYKPGRVRKSKPALPAGETV